MVMFVRHEHSGHSKRVNQDRINLQQKIQPPGTQGGKRQEPEKELLDGNFSPLLKIGRIADLGVVYLATGAENDFQKEKDDDKNYEYGKHGLIQQEACR
ncbi:MAG TPA: hypothetical protein VLR45_11720 [Desulfoprunum sp.]|nr:hypothetical protein [Desulfoprunum sp.]